MRTPYPQPVCELAGTRRVIETATKVIGGMWGDEGSSRVQHAWTADPRHRPPPRDRAGRVHPRRRVHLGPDRPPPALPAAPARPAPRTAVVIPQPAARAPGRRSPAAPAALDDVFGPGDPPMTATNPFAALGLPARPDLTDEQVRTAWRPVAAATHPDRPDGGDPARYAEASAAYAVLRTPWGRSEAYADLTASPAAPSAARPRRLAARPGPGRRRAVAADPGPDLARPARGWRCGSSPPSCWPSSRRSPARAARLWLGWPPGIGVWLVLTVRADLAPPPGR